MTTTIASNRVGCLLFGSIQTGGVSIVIVRPGARTRSDCGRNEFEVRNTHGQDHWSMAVSVIRQKLRAARQEEGTASRTRSVWGNQPSEGWTWEETLARY